MNLSALFMVISFIVLVSVSVWLYMYQMEIDTNCHSVCQRIFNSPDAFCDENKTCWPPAKNLTKYINPSFDEVPQ